MNREKDTIDSVAEFLAHALEVEEESAAHYATLADSMEVHHNTEVAALFRRLEGYSELHAGEVRERCRALAVDLPNIPPWEFKWHCPGTPETSCTDVEVHYQMSPRQALELALFNEQQGRDFYAAVAQASGSAKVRQLAAEMAAEEEEHVVLLEKWLQRGEIGLARAPEDLDPPNMPE